MQNAEKIDIKSMTGNLPALQKIEEQEKIFYQLLKDKNIELKDHTDIERIEKFFNNTLKNMLEIVKKSNFDSFDKDFLKVKLIIDFHAKIAEKFNIDVMYFPQLLGRYNNDIFTKAVEDFNRF